jgi:small GTP-binding protein
MEPGDRPRKIVFVGRIGVGKTSLIRYLEAGPGDLGQYEPTIGITTHTMACSVEGQAVSIDLIDTAGEERYGAIVPKYVRGADAVALCFDPTEAAWLAGVTQYLALVREADPSMPIAPVATKHDQWVLVEGTEAQFQEEIKRLNFPGVYATSAVTGEGIDGAKKALAELALMAKEEVPVGLNIDHPSPAKESTCSC